MRPSLHPLHRALCAGLVAWALALAPISLHARGAGLISLHARGAGLISLHARGAGLITLHAAPASGSTSEGPTTASATPEPAAIRSALEAGDLTTARELAVARSEAEPNADSFALEAEVHLALGDYETTKAALDRALESLPADAEADRETLVALRDEIEARSRGARADEPMSSHREQIDRERAERLAALAPKPSVPTEPVDEPKPRKPIIKKWYFWVTLGAVVATAGAIVGVAISSAVEERKDTAAGRSALPAGGMTIRF